jgi:hypothetical protein
MSKRAIMFWGVCVLSVNDIHERFVVIQPGRSDAAKGV